MAVSAVGLAVNVQCALVGGPAMKVTVVVALKEPAVAVTVLTSAVLDASVVL